MGNAVLTSARQRVGDCRIGLSGWSYPEWKGLFYPERWPQRRFLEYYGQHFNTVEVNNTFYGTPKPETLVKWYETVPEDFVFAIKANRVFTHMTKLAPEPDSLVRFFDTLDPLGEKLGPILFQLPPKWGFDPDRLRHFLKRLPKGYRYAFECRDRGWINDETRHILESANAAFCIYDLRRFESPGWLTADFAYLRFHGPGRTPYRGHYEEAFMQRWGESLSDWRQQGADVFCYFDNTADGAALGDVESLQTILGHSD